MNNGQQHISSVNYYFDHVYVINLERRSDRKIAMLQKLSSLGIKAEFVRAINGCTTQNELEHQFYLEQPIGINGSHLLEIAYQRKLIKSPGAWGYLKTYYGILADAKKRNYGRILIFDDDVIFHKDFEYRFQKSIELIPHDWKLFYLGASQYLWKIPEGLSYPDENKIEIDLNEPFYHPNGTDGSFAVGIDASVFDLLKFEILKMNCPFDSGALRTVTETYPKQCFTLFPNLVIADVSESDIREGQNQKKLAERLKWDLEVYEFQIKKDLVSVIMPAFNAETTIEKAIRSILMQTYQDLELIVVDDASTDNTAKVVQKLMKEDLRVKLVALEINKGVGEARNTGLKASQGKIIAYQDADDVSLKNRIEKQLIPIYEKGVLFTTSLIYRSRCTSVELDIYNQEAMIDLVKSRQLPDSRGGFSYIDRAIMGWVTTVIKRDAFEQFGLYENHRFGEDLEFVERILYFKMGKIFSKDFNAHVFLSKRKPISRLFYRIDEVLYVCPKLNDQNLTSQYIKRREENLQNHESFRNKFINSHLSVYPKLPLLAKSENNPLNILYNTLHLNSKVLLPEVEYQQLNGLADLGTKFISERSELDKVFNSISWKITAPLRWVGKRARKLFSKFT